MPNKTEDMSAEDAISRIRQCETQTGLVVKFNMPKAIEIINQQRQQAIKEALPNYIEMSLEVERLKTALSGVKHTLDCGVYTSGYFLSGIDSEGNHYSKSSAGQCSCVVKAIKPSPIDTTGILRLAKAAIRLSEIREEFRRGSSIHPDTSEFFELHHKMADIAAALPDHIKTLLKEVG